MIELIEVELKNYITIKFAALDACWKSQITASWNNYNHKIMLLKPIWKLCCCVLSMRNDF